MYCFWSGGLRFGVIALLSGFAGSACGQVQYQVTDFRALLGSNNTSATGINDSGQVVGAARDGNGSGYGFLYSSGNTTNIGNFSPTALNNAGVVVGDGGASGAVAYKGGALVALVTGVGGPLSACAINDAGVVVVDSDAGIPGIANLSVSGSALPPFLSQYDPNFPFYAYGINDSGQVVGGTAFWSGSHCLCLLN